MTTMMATGFLSLDSYQAPYSLHLTLSVPSCFLSSLWPTWWICHQFFPKNLNWYNFSLNSFFLKIKTAKSRVIYLNRKPLKSITTHSQSRLDSDLLVGNLKCINLVNKVWLIRKLFCSDVIYNLHNLDKRIKTATYIAYWCSYIAFATAFAIFVLRWGSSWFKPFFLLSPFSSHSHNAMKLRVQNFKTY